MFSFLTHPIFFTQDSGVRKGEYSRHMHFSLILKIAQWAGCNHHLILQMRTLKLRDGKLNWSAGGHAASKSRSQEFRQRSFWLWNHALNFYATQPVSHFYSTILKYLMSICYVPGTVDTMNMQSLFSGAYKAGAWRQQTAGQPQKVWL